MNTPLFNEKIIKIVSKIVGVVNLIPDIINILL